MQWVQDMSAAQAMPAEVDATADLAAIGPRPPPVPQSAAGATLHMPSTIPEEPEDVSVDHGSGPAATPRTAGGGSTARSRTRDRDRSIAEIVLEESVSLTEALANVEMTQQHSNASSLLQWIGDDGDASEATLPLSDTLMPAALLGPGTPRSPSHMRTKFAEASMPVATELPRSRFRHSSPDRVPVFSNGINTSAMPDPL